MSSSSPSHPQVVTDVEEALRDAVQEQMQGSLREGLLALWRDFADQRDVGRTQKPETWAAAVLYAFEQLHMSAVSQSEVAAWFDVSTGTVGQKYREIADVLDLKVADARYLAEARRQDLRREYGRLPEDVRLRDLSHGRWWHLPFGFRDDDPLQDAQELVYDGWDALAAGDPAEAETCFERALDLDEWIADAHNGLGHLALSRNEMDAAASHFETAYELARETLGTESPGAYYWWGQIQTRPYMRAREGRADVLQRTGRFREAVAEYEALLELNPNDNQGARYVIGPLYQLAGDLDAALDAYTQYERRYPDDRGDPHHTFCWGLALFNDGQHFNALQRWRTGLFQNLYIAPALLGEPFPPEDVWFRSNLEMPYYAQNYLDRYGALWESASDAQAALGALWTYDDVRDDREQWISLGRTLHTLLERAREGDDEARSRWSTMVERQYQIEARSLNRSALRRILKEARQR